MLQECDLNSPEPNATLYGPFPVNRVINGIDGMHSRDRLVTLLC